VASGTSRQLARRQALRARLAQADLACLLVTKPANVRYLTGFSGSYGAVLLLHDHTLFFTDRRYERQASSQVEEAELVLAPGDLIGAVVSVVSPLDEGIGFEPAGLSFRDGQRLRSSLRGRPVVPAPQLVEDLREVKDEAELASMAEAARLGGVTLEDVLGKLRPGITEREVALELEVGMRRRGADGLAFASIVAFGEHAAEPHHEPGGRPLRAGDFVTLDFGARSDGYCSDMTRTVVLGLASERQRELYELVRRAQAAGLAALRAGVTGAAGDRASRDGVGAAGGAAPGSPRPASATPSVTRPDTGSGWRSTKRPGCARARMVGSRQGRQ
jgi:Xaa-Pro aminopeptidase